MIRINTNILEKEDVNKMIDIKIAQQDRFFLEEMDKLRNSIVELDKIIAMRTKLPIIKRGRER